MSDAPADLTILRPRIARVTRVDSTGLSVGDEAIAVLAPGLLQFLMSRDTDGARLDQGLSSEWMTPIGIAGAAVYAVLRPVGGIASPWTGARNTVTWSRPARIGEECTAHVRITSLGRTSAAVAYTVAGGASAETLVSGELIMVYVPAGAPVSIDGICAPGGRGPGYGAEAAGGTRRAAPSTQRQGAERLIYVLTTRTGMVGANRDDAVLLEELNRVGDVYGARWTHYGNRWSFGVAGEVGVHERAQWPGRAVSSTTALLRAALHTRGAVGVMDFLGPESPTIDLGRPVADVNAALNARIASAAAPVHVIAASLDVAGALGGGAPERIEQHIRHVRDAYPWIEMATASEAAAALAAHHRAPLRGLLADPVEVRTDETRTLVHIPIRFIGNASTPRADAPVPMSIGAPQYLDSRLIRMMRVLEHGAVIAEGHGAPGEEASGLAFHARAGFGYELEIEVEPGTISARSAVAGGHSGAGSGMIFQLRRPRCVFWSRRELDKPAPGDTWVWEFPGDLLRLMANPAAGGTDPIGREFHPYGRLSEGAMVYAAMRAFNDRYAPRGLVLHYTNAVRGDRDFTLRLRLSSVDGRALVADCTFFEGPVPVAEAQLTCVAQ